MLLVSIHPTIKLFFICLSGFLLSLSAPGYDLWFLAWILISPLFIVINTSKNVKETVLYSFIFGFSYNFWYLHWLFSLYPLDWLGFNNFQSLLISFLALFVTSACAAMFFVLFSLCVIFLKRISPFLKNKSIVNCVVISFIWLIVFNKLSSLKLLFGFPWTLIEYSQYKNIFLIQIAEYFGSLSVSFLIVFFNQVLADFIVWLFNVEKISNRYVPKTPGYFGTVVFSFLFILILISMCTVYGAYLFNKNTEQFSNLSQSVSVIQGNLPIKTTRGEGLDIMLARKTYSELINNSNAALIITPEGSLPAIFNFDLATQYWLKSQIFKKQSDIISGTYCKSEKALTNCAVSYGLSSKTFSYYEKERLVPFGEFTPFVFILPDFLKKLAVNIIGNGFEPGEKNSPVLTSIGKVGINICFELIFPTIIRKHVVEGAKVLVNISDLSWFSNDIVKQQFLAFAVFRAIENRKPLVIATNNGISAFVEPNGKIKSQSLPSTQGVLLNWVNPNNKVTFYAKYGW